MRHIISILLQNEAGALSRVAAMFSTRGYNIESLNVAPTDNPVVSRLTLVTTGSDEVIRQINNQLLKIVDVVNLADMTLGDHMERELLLFKIHLSGEPDETLTQLIDREQARVLDDSPDSFTVELTSTGGRIDDFIQKADNHGQILAVVRSGPLAMSRGRKVLGIPV